MVYGSIADIESRAMELRRLFPTGLVISPSHEALLPDVPAATLRR
jgi:uroporphyrinogen decarboxylase